MHAMTICLVAMLALCACGATGDDGRTGREMGPAQDRTPTPAEREALQASLDEARDLFRSRAYDDARAAYEQVAERAREVGAADVEALACARVARVFSIRRDPEGGAAWLARAEALADESMPEAWARTTIVRGIYLREDGRGDEATALFVSCYDYAMAHGLHGDAVDAAHHVAIAADAATREQWAKKGIAAAEAAGESAWLGPLWNNLGWDYIDQGRDAEALDALRRAQTAFHAQGGHPTSALISDYSVGFALRRNGELAQARSVQDAVHRAATTALEGGDESMLEWVAQSRRELGELDALEGRPLEGADAIEQAIEELKRTDFPSWGAEYLAQYEARVAELRGEGDDDR